MGGLLSSPQILTRKVAGQFRVGCKDVMIDGLFMKLYYPTDSEVTDIAAYPLWLPRPEYAHGLGEYLGQSKQKMDLISATIVGDKREDCIDNASLSLKHEKWPILIFSHGLGGSRNFYSTYCTSLASHGYVIAAVEHKDHSACWTYNLTEKNGELVEEPIKIKLIEKNDPEEFRMRNQQVNQRVSECVNALKLLENLNSGVAPEKVLIGKDFDWRQFENQLNISTAAIIGHSFGGATSLASASNGFQKSIVLDGWMFPLDACQQQTSIKPILFLNVGDWQWEENLEVMKRMLPNNEGNLVLTLNGGVHQSFSDFPFIFPNWLAKHFGVQGSTESTLCIQAAIELTLAFLENGKEGAQRVKEEKFFNFITNEIYGRERFKILGV